MAKLPFVFSSPETGHRLLLPLAFLVLVGMTYACSAAPTSTQESGAVSIATQAGVSTEAPVSTEPPASTEAPGSTEAPAAAPVIPEERVLTVEWPAAIRTGDSDVVRLTLVVDEQGNITPTAQVSGNQVRSQGVQIPNVYDTHQVMAEARLDMAGITISPMGEITEPMQPGEAVTFIWSVLPQSVGTYRGTIWLHLLFIPKAGGQAQRSVLSAQAIQIKAVNLFGLGGVPGAYWEGWGLSLALCLAWIILFPGYGN